MNKIEDKICIIGAGGFGKETIGYLSDIISGSDDRVEDIAIFMVDDQFLSISEVHGIKVIPFSSFNTGLYKVVIAIGDPVVRKRMVHSLPGNSRYTTIIHPSTVLSKWVKIGEGSIIAPGTVVSCDTSVGKHSHLNVHTYVGHDCEIGDYFTTAPGVKISGNCKINNNVYFGANSTIKQRVQICDNVTIGMGAVVVKSIFEPGTYIGNPAQKLIKG